MPRTSPYHLTLTDAERTELEGRARRYTSPYSDVVRAKIVLYAAQGLGNDEIAARLDTPRQVVSKWRKRFHEQRLPGLADQPQGGRPPQFFPLTSSSRSKRWPANCPPQPAHRWPAGTARTWPEQPSSMHRAKVFGRCEQTTGIDPFDRLVDQVMTTEPYATARRVFWVVDNGSSHRGQASIDRLQHRWPKLRLIHLPVHASWLNQVEIYFSVVQRKVVSPNDFHTLDEVEARLLDFQQYYEQIATPFE
jgi:transposase-like protein